MTIHRPSPQGTPVVREETRKAHSGAGEGLHMKREGWEEEVMGTSWWRLYLKGSLAPGSQRMRDSSSPRSGLTLTFKNQGEGSADDAN